MQEAINQNFKYIFEKDLLEEINQIGHYKKVEAGDTLIEIGSYVKYMPLLLSGAIKVLRQDEDGHEIILYFLEKGDTCAMTLNCCMSQAISEIKAVAEIDSELVLVPVAKMEQWLKFKTWRHFVFNSYNNRLSEMLEAIDLLAFKNLDERLIKYLEDKVIINKNKLLEITHLDIALELNTSRVVISRLLKKLEIDQKIKLLRNKIEILSI